MVKTKEELKAKWDKEWQLGDSGNALNYANLIPKLREIALDYGYAMGVHGSLRNDLDIILIPWG